MATNNLVYSIVAKANPAAKGLNKIADALDRIANVGKEARDTLEGVIPGNVSVEIKKTTNSVKQAGNHAKSATGKFAMFAASIKRVAFYRAIRTALKEVTQAFREGTNNLVLYSQALGNVDSARASGTMNEFATTALYVKNTLGAALMPILQALVPIVTAIANAFVAAANAINQFFHALKGEGVFTKAKKYAVEYADALGGAAGAAKELKKQIFGFDELNIFNSPNAGGGGGGASGLDYSKMFEEAELTGIFAKIRDVINKNLGEDFNAKFKLNFSEFFVEWKGLNKEQIAKKILTGFYGLAGGIVGFAIGGPMGAIVGSLLGVTLGTYISTMDFNGDGKLDNNEIATALKDVALTLTGAAIGWAVGGPGGALLGASLAAGMTVLFKTFYPKAATDVSSEIGEMLRIVAGGLTGAAIGWVVGGPGGALLGASIGASLTAMITWFAPKAGTKLEEGAFLGLLVSTLIAIINPTGTLFVANMNILAITALAAVTLAVSSILTDAGYKTSQDKFIALLAETIGIIVGAVAGASLLAFTPLAGALVGITVGATLTLVITKVFQNYTPQSKRELEQMGQRVNLQAAANYRGSPSSSTTPVKPTIFKAEAEGGIVPSGTYFYAGEAGPELIGTVGSKTNVTNQDQFTAGMEDIMDNTNTVILQAAQALIQAVKEIPATTVTIGDRDIVNAYDRGKSLAGGSLVV